jgi:hypothetical protein
MTIVRVSAGPTVTPNGHEIYHTKVIIFQYLISNKIKKTKQTAAFYFLQKINSKKLDIPTKRR